jgi:mannose/fructose/N-acetylgalactosamine-specific phosphotransferase system component IIC
MPYSFRFSLGQLMGVIAISALLTANAIFISRGNFTSFTLIGAALSCAWLGVLFFNRRLSGWIWVWIAGQTGPLLWLAGSDLVFVLRHSLYYSNNAYQAIQATLYLVCSIISFLGFAMTLRDIRRRLAIYEDAPST